MQAGKAAVIFVRLLNSIDQSSENIGQMSNFRLPRTLRIERRTGGPPEGLVIIGRPTLADDTVGYAIIFWKSKLL